CGGKPDQSVLGQRVGARCRLRDFPDGAVAQAERNFREPENVTRLQLAGAAVVLTGLMMVPLVVPTDYGLQVLFRIGLFAALGLAWNLVGGYAGQLSLGHAAYFGAGAYGLALFAGRLGM